MKKNVEEFCRRVKKQMTEKDSDLVMVQQTIEIAYDQNIAAKMEKSFFLGELQRIDEEVFALTVNHLFTPINWSRLKLRILWGIKNITTGNLLSLDRDTTEETMFSLKESGDALNQLDYSPMLTGDEEDAKMFIKMISEIPSDAPLGIDDTIISLNIDDKINVANLEVVEVRVIF